MENFKEFVDAGYRPKSDPMATGWVGYRDDGWADKVGFTMRMVNAEGDEGLCTIQNEEELREVFKFRAEIDPAWGAELAERQKAYSFKRPGAMDPRMVLDQLASTLAYTKQLDGEVALPAKDLEFIRKFLRESGYPVGNDPNVTERRAVNYMPPEYEENRRAARMR